MPFPYFTYRNKIYFRKIDVFRELSAPTDFKRIHYNFYDDTFYNSNWWVEPTESIDSLFKQRFIELLDKYKKLRLFFSGGYDCYIILLQAIKHNINFDEIVYIRTDFSETDDEFADLELYDQFYPIVNAFKDHLQNTKIKVWSTPFSKIANIDGTININTISDDLSIFTASPHSCKYLKEGHLLSSHGNIWGDPKSRISMSHDGQIYFSADSNQVYQGDFSDMNNEFFYISDKNNKLFLKLTHMLKNYFIENNIKKPFSTADDVTKAFKIPYFNEMQSSNLGKVYISDDPKKMFWPFYRGKNFLRIKAALKHEHSKHFYEMWREYFVDSIRNQKPWLLNDKRSNFKPVHSNYYNLSSNEIIDAHDFNPYPLQVDGETTFFLSDYLKTRIGHLI